MGSPLSSTLSIGGFKDQSITAATVVYRFIPI